jgi:hypothetical protein
VRVVRVNLRLVVALGALAMATPAHAAPISAHAMVHTCCMESATKERIFSEASAVGAAYIRVDVELDPIFEDAEGDERATPDWERLDEVMELSRRHRLPVLAILLAPAGDADEFGKRAGIVAEHAAGTIGHWEILNEPDAAWAFDGTAEEYAAMLSSAYDAIKARTPGARIVMGGLQRPDQLRWLERVFATPGADALHKFDVAAIHLRGPVDPVVRRYGEFRSWLAARGFSGPVWVTEHGYPADPAFQVDPAYAAGDASQAAYLTQTLVGLGEAGAEQVFVTLRDNLEGEYASEGVVHIDEAGGNATTRRPAFAALRRLASDWGQVMSWRQEQRENERLLVSDQADLADKARKTRLARAEFQEARVLVEAAEDALATPRAATKRARQRLVRRLTLRLERARALMAGRRMMLIWDSAITRWQRRVTYERAATIYALKERIAGR